MMFNWKYALDKLLIFLTSTTNIALAAGALLAVFGIELSPEVQAFIVEGAVIAMALFKLLDKVFDKTPKPAVVG